MFWDLPDVLPDNPALTRRTYPLYERFNAMDEKQLAADSQAVGIGERETCVAPARYRADLGERIETLNKKSVYAAEGTSIETKTGDMLLKAKNTIRLEAKTIETTVGRVIFSEIWPEELGFSPAMREKLRDLTDGRTGAILCCGTPMSACPTSPGAPTRRAPRGRSCDRSRPRSIASRSPGPGRSLCRCIRPGPG